MKFRNIFSIIKKELKGYFDNPTAYIILIVFLVLWEFLFFRSAFLSGESSLRNLFGVLPWLFLFLVPAITMGSISQEKKDGTIEFLLTRPLKDMELIVGKFLAGFLFAAIALLFVFPIAWSFSNYGNFDWGALCGQYLGALFMAGVLIALGIFVSGIFSSQVSALLVSVAGSFFLIIAGYGLITERMPLFLAPILEQLSVSTHFESMSRGVIDLRDIWYFLSATAVFLSLAYLWLIKRRYGNNKKAYHNYQAAVWLFVGIAILTNGLSARIPGRIDLTENKSYTISESSKKILGNLDDVVNIDFYASEKLPAQMQSVLRDTADILRDYKTFGKGNILVSQKDPSDDEDLSKEAELLGIQQVQFNVVSQEEFQVKNGYLGLAVSYGGAHEIIPFIQNTDDLEYQLTSFIRKLTAKDKKKMGFLSGHGEKTLSRDYSLLKKELDKQFEVEDIGGAGADEKEGAQKKLEIPDDISVLVIAGAATEINEQEKKAVADFIDKGKSAMFFVDTVSIMPQTLTASINKNGLTGLLEEKYGIKVNEDMIYDLRSNEVLGFGSFYSPYPFWARVQIANQNSPITSKIESVTVPWGSSLSGNDDKIKESGFVKTDLLKTTKFAGAQTGTFVLKPDQSFSKENLGEKIVAVSLEKSGGSRIVIVGDSDFLTDDIAGKSSGNLAFGMESFSWVAQDESIVGIKIRNSGQGKLVFENAADAEAVKFGNLGLAFTLPFVVGFFRIYRRRKMQERPYEAN